MKRITVVVAACVLALATGGVALAGGVSGMATGGAKYVATTDNLAQIDFNAKIGPNGPQGRVHRRVLDMSGNFVREFVGSVNCYSQQGNVARFSGVITNSINDDPALNGQYFLWVVQDNGEGASAPPDLVKVDRATTPYDCTASQMMPTQPVDNGSIQVR